MAEAIVIGLVEKIGAALAAEVIKPVFSWLGEEMLLSREVRTRMDRIRSEFVVMQAFLRFAGGAWKAGGEPVAAWVEAVRDVAYHVEDVVDEYTHLVTSHCQRRGRGFETLLRKPFSRSKNFKAWHRINTQLQEIEIRLVDLSNMKERYGIIKPIQGASSDDHGSERRRQLDELVHFVDEEEIVGTEETKNVLARWLTDDDEPSSCTTVSVWGMGGSGKTTLVASVYRSQVIRRHFNCYAWVSVSQSYKTDDLLRRIMKEFSDEMDLVPFNVADTGSYRKLVKTLQTYLHQKRYLIILDDVWHTDVWSDIICAFPECQRGSRIVITTRNHDVASLAAGSRVIELQLLKESEAWELFCKKAFPREKGRICPPELECWASRIVEKCRGLPLSITIIGSLLSLKDMKELEWKKVHDRLNWELTSNTERDRVKNILNLSFDNLPGHLKNCFLYCSIFPEDHLIYRKRLIRLWVAEGFVRERSGNTMEETAEDYLGELIQLCMLQVVKTNGVGRVKACRMHDLLRELTLSKSRQENFCMVFDTGLEEARPAAIARHLSVHQSSSSNSNDAGDVQPSSAAKVKACGVHELMRELTLSKSRRENFCMACDASLEEATPAKSISDIQLSRGLWHPRSFIVFAAAAAASASSLDYSLHSMTISGNFKLLRVLDLQGVPLRTLPKQVADLFNLHYLSLRKTQVRELPSSLQRLHNLQTLDLWGTYVKRLPRGTTKLENLRHLFLYDTSDPAFRTFSPLSGAEAPKGVWGLKSLQTLCYVEANREMVRGVGDLTQLRTFGITKVRAAHCAELCASVARMRHLLTLAVVAGDEGEGLQLDAMCPPPPLLQKLALFGRMEEGAVPPWVGSLANLTHLTLYWCRLRDDPLPTLSGLPSLAHLYLRNAYQGQELRFRRGWLVKLKSLFLVDAPLLRWVRVDEGALAGLRQLGLVRCGQLKAVPLGIERLAALQELFLREMSAELVERLRRGGGGRVEGGCDDNDDSLRIQHIPVVTLVFQRDGEWIREVRSAD